MNYRLAFLLSIVFLLAFTPGYSQYDSHGKWTVNGRAYKIKPKAVLVQLRSEQRKITYAKQYNPGLLPRIQQEAQRVRQLTINDFTDHFNFCPVYYYIDTNANLIKEKKFAGILLDEHYNLIKNPVVDADNSNYTIVYYGAPAVENDRDTTVHKYAYNTRDVMGKALIILNNQYQIVDYYAVLNHWWPLYFTSLVNKRYTFISKRYDIEYRPLAKWYNEELTRRFSNTD